MRWSAMPRAARCSGGSSSQQLQQALSQPIKAGIRQLVAIQPDKLGVHQRRHRPARDRGVHRPVRRNDRRDAPGERPVRPLRRRHVRAADGARHAARRRDLGEQPDPQGRLAGVPRRRQADVLHVQRRHRHDRHPHAGYRALDQRRADRAAQRRSRRRQPAWRSSTRRTRTRASRPRTRSGCATSARR